MDTLDAALSLGAHPPVARSLAGEINWNPLILNFGDAHRPGHRPGDGWRNGDFTQSESLCYRTSLATSLEKARWPLPYFSAIYSPYVVVIRGPWETGDELLDIDSPHTLPVVSAITASMIWQPEKRSFNIPSGPDFRKKWIFRWDGDRHATKDRMRLVLRLSAYHRHPRIVLGAIGCGINTYQNPAEDMAHCWLEVLREDEFSSACWWTDVVFAVLDKPGTRAEDSNYRIFKRVLHGQMVGGCDWLHDD
ncbi:hypothetical protein B0T21DRAFT_384151 [Apiosordaria backusii]|uniref:Microbial-type PARG catalytic domain-containing protein n=1 Tax=Apiosordaria backusii TaxID=314023 RepID=A0AA40BM12_9PEZI|nr:hypothetical protein B0T21DRAFT_384151 [Apiosordaria backusii]